MRSILHTIHKGFALISATQAATEIEDSGVVFQWKVTEEFFLFLKSALDRFRGIPRTLDKVDPALFHNHCLRDQMDAYRYKLSIVLRSQS